MKNSEAMKCMATVMAAWPWPEFADERIALYAKMLLDLEFGECMAAIERLVLTAEKQPSVATVRAEVQRGASDRPDPEIAWGEVMKAIGRFGMNRRPEFSCPELSAAVDAIGWRSICLEENVSSTRARFIDAYRSIHSSTVRREVLGPRGGDGGALPPAAGPRRLVEARSTDEFDESAVDRDPSTMSPWAKQLVEKYGPSVK